MALSMVKILRPVVNGLAFSSVVSRRVVARSLHLTSCVQCETPREEVPIENNPFYDKYADKIKDLRRSDPERFETRLHLMKEAKARKRAVESNKDETHSLSEKPSPKLMSPEGSGKQKSLDSVVDVTLLRGHTKEEITEIWRDYHQDKDFICAVIPGDVYNRIHDRARECPMFLYPVPRNDGYEFFFAQFDNHSCHFTSVINYQTYQENAPALLILTHYPELQEDKGIVLMRGEMDTKFVSVQDAQFLANQLQLYYATDDSARQALLTNFNQRPSEFKHMDLIEQLSNTTIS